MENKLKQDVPIGHNLKKYRQAVGLSQEGVAAKLQVLGLGFTMQVQQFGV